MFSGIIESLGRVRSVEPGDKAVRIVLDTGFADLVLGESVAVNGVCLTVTEFDAAGAAAFFVSPETLGRTSLGVLREGAQVNLERAVTPSTRLSGHIVQGHVDGTAILVSISAEGDARALVLELPDTLRRYCVEKGSIALDGISLTVNAILPSAGPGRFGPGRFGIALMIIPHTWEHTNLGTLTPGASVNVEVDVIAKYVEQLCQRPS
jgi:riboflavin synthase